MIDLDQGRQDLLGCSVTGNVMAWLESDKGWAKDEAQKTETTRMLSSVVYVLLESQLPTLCHGFDESQ